jgi:flagellar basal body-associated protein FliL
MQWGQSTSLDSDNSNLQSQAPAEPDARSSWIRVGAVAAASALAGGLAAAWFYRKTLKRMQAENSNFRMAEDSDDEI